MNHYVQVLPIVQPYCVILWKLNGLILSKTVCYTSEDEMLALDRYQTPGDLYNGYDEFLIEYSHVDERKWA